MSNEPKTGDVVSFPFKTSGPSGKAVVIIREGVIVGVESGPSGPVAIVEVRELYGTKLRYKSKLCDCSAKIPKVPGPTESTSTDPITAPIKKAKKKAAKKKRAKKVEKTLEPEEG